MKVISRYVGLDRAELVSVVETEDIGKTFTCEATMIPYSLGRGTMSEIKLTGDGVRVGYKEVEEIEDCFICNGTGINSSTRKRTVGRFKKREVVEPYTWACVMCNGTGKRKVIHQVSIED